MTEPFGYTGSLCPLPNAPPHLWAAMQRLGERLLEAEPFLGLFNVDAILDERGDVWPLEVNPRYSAGMETVEAIGGRPLLEPPDAEAPLEPSPQKAPPESAGVAAKAIAYARPGAPAQAPDLAEAFEIHRELRDVPRPGTPIRPGWPICTLWVHQEADADPEGARRGLAALMDRLYTHLV
jgi:predicted ATP-grasp superfamily ATP-dependent carboligase